MAVPWGAVVKKTGWNFMGKSMMLLDMERGHCDYLRSLRSGQFFSRREHGIWGVAVKDCLGVMREVLRLMARGWENGVAHCLISYILYQFMGRLHLPKT